MWDGPVFPARSVLHGRGPRLRKAKRMKLSEFEEKLANLPDERLRHMLAKCRKEGPEVAVKLILAEALRRGMDSMEEAPGPSRNASITQAPAPPERYAPQAESAVPVYVDAVPEAAPFVPEARAAVPEAAPFTSEARAAIPEVAPFTPEGGAAVHGIGEGLGPDPEVDPSAPAFAATPAWLSEESSRGLSPFVKFILFLVTFGGAIGVLFRILRKG